MEEADGCRIRTAGWSWKLFGLTENVPISVFLPPEFIGYSGQHDSGRRGCCHVQQYVPDSVHTASVSPETARPQSAHSRPGPWGTTGTKPDSKPNTGHTASSVKRKDTERQMYHTWCDGLRWTFTRRIFSPTLKDDFIEEKDVLFNMDHFWHIGQTKPDEPVDRDSKRTVHCQIVCFVFFGTNTLILVHTLIKFIRFKKKGE